MSWLPRSIADNLNPRISGEVADEEIQVEIGDDRGAGVREDLSEFTETLTRQLWDVASFLAPPPPPPPPPPIRLRCHVRTGSENRDHDDQSCSVEEYEEEVVGRNLEEDEEVVVRNAIGITEEVLAFAMNIAHHPETWLDFPEDDDEEENAVDFKMSDAQRRHVLAVQCLAPRLAALRIELCPAHMSENYFWKVYFVLLHPRLNKQDADILSTPQTVAARGIWMKELQKRTNKETDWSPRGISDVTNKWHESFDNALMRTSVLGSSSYATNEPETIKHPIVSTEMQFIDKAVIEEKPFIKNKSKYHGAAPSFKLYSCNFEEDEDDDWLKEDSELEGYNTNAIVIGNDDDVSFSDLEEDDCNCTMPT